VLASPLAAFMPKALSSITYGGWFKRDADPPCDPCRR
jgi:hypothetical protein